MGGETVTIVGVLPAGAGFTHEDIFLPVRAGLDTPDRRSTRPYEILARLSSTTTMDEANEEFRLLARRLSAAYPGTNRGVSARVLSHVEARLGASGTGRLLRLTGALIFLIAIANVTNLFLVRACARNRELQLRLAMGASQWRVVRHFIGEALAPVAAGAIGGAVFAAEALQWFGGGNGPTYRFEIQHGVFVAAMSVLAIAIIGTVAGLQTMRRNRHFSLTDGARGNTGRHFSRVGRGLVIAEIAMGGAALFVAGLMIKTSVNLETVDYGFAIADVMTGTVQLDGARYPTPEARLAFWDAWRTRAKAIPGVKEATLATQLPMIRYRGWSRFRLDGDAPTTDAEYSSGLRSAITPEFFETFEKTLLQGRPLTEADGPNAEPVVIVNEDFVRKFIADGNALGRRIKLGGRGSTRPWMRVVGIAPHMWMDSDVDRLPEGGYVPLAQFDPDYASIALRVSGNPQDYREVLRETLMGLDPNLPLDAPRTMSELIHQRTRLYRRLGPQFIFLGAVALMLSMVGLYGVMAYMARTRVQEIGIRMALGAQHASILRLIVKQGVAQIAGGVTLGVGVALYISTGISRMVFQMTPWDPWVLTLSFTALALTGLAATLIPARQATRVDPLVALRAD